MYDLKCFWKKLQVSECQQTLVNHLSKIYWSNRPVFGIARDAWFWWFWDYFHFVSRFSQSGNTWGKLHPCFAKIARVLRDKFIYENLSLFRIDIESLCSAYLLTTHSVLPFYAFFCCLALLSNSSPSWTWFWTSEQVIAPQNFLHSTAAWS